MRQLIDLTGMKFGRLTVIERAENSKCGQPRWLCKCDCGNEVVVQGGHLISGHTVSCGCFRKEITREKSTTHGMRHTKIYNTWYDIKRRCYNPNRKDYKHYGGRGITMFPEWIDDFQAFYNYVSNLPHFGEEGYSLDRINNNGNYEPDNLRWADSKTQKRNTRRNQLVQFGDRWITLAELSEITGIPYKTLQDRLRRGDTGERLCRPVKKASS